MNQEDLKEQMKKRKRCLIAYLLGHMLGESELRSIKKVKRGLIL
jgi:hypothetical protein